MSTTASMRTILPVEIKALRLSKNDNPGWKIIAEDGIYTTEVDSDSAYAVTPDDVGRPVNIEVNDAGKIVTYEPATSTALDRAVTNEQSAWALTNIDTILNQPDLDATTIMAAINRHVKHWDYVTHEQAARRKAERKARREFYHLPTHKH